MLLCQRVTYDTTYCSLQFDLNIAGSFRRSLFQISVHPDVTPNTAKSTNKKKNFKFSSIHCAVFIQGPEILFSF
jgi:hypothetical protein